MHSQVGGGWMGPLVEQVMKERDDSKRCERPLTERNECLGEGMLKNCVSLLQYALKSSDSLARGRRRK